MSKRNLFKTILRELRPEALWDLIKYALFLGISLLSLLAYRLLAWLRELPHDRVIDATIFLGAFILITGAYVLSRLRSRSYLSEGQDQQQMEEGQWHTTAGYDLTPRRVAQPFPTNQRNTSGVTATEITQTEPEPNLVCRDAHLTWVTIDDQEICWERGETEEARLGAVVTFSNEVEPNRRTSDINNLKAQITYYLPDGKLYHRVERGTWITEDFNSIDLDRGEARKLVIALWEQDTYDTEKGHAITIQNNHGDWQRYHAMDLFELDGKRFNVRVRLIGGSESDLVKDYSFILSIKPAFDIYNEVSLQDKEKKIQLVREKLHMLVEAGNEIFDRCGDKTQRVPAKDFRLWSYEAENILDILLGETAVERFNRPVEFKQPPNSQMIITGEPERHRIWNELHGRIQRLNEFLIETLPVK